MEISRARTTFLKYRIKSEEIGGNESRHSIRLGDQLIIRVKEFKYLESVVQENRRIIENVTSRIKCGWMKLREATGVLYDKKGTVKE